MRPLHPPKMLEMTKELTMAVANFYEYSMAQANFLEEITGQVAVFDVVVRNLPTNKVVGNFERGGIKYDELAPRSFLVNAGLEQAAACLLNGKGNIPLRNYFETIQGVSDQKFLDWIEHFSFQGDLYGIPEGTIFFAQESQLRIHERFEEIQLYESLLLDCVNAQTNVATAANDIATLVDKILLEGGSHRATSPQSAIFNSRAARIGGFTLSSNVAFGIEYQEKVGGTHGHSYVMLHASEYTAFKAQGKLFGRKVCFLLDTYDIPHALETALKVTKEQELDHFAFRLDSGNLLQQSHALHQTLASRGYSRQSYDLIVSDDLTVGKIASLEEQGADVNKYLVGTYVVNPPRPVTGVLKLAAFKDLHGEWNNRGKISADPTKSTLPGIKQVYRVAGEDGYFKKDVIALEGEDLSHYLEQGDTTEALLIPIITKGVQVYDFPSISHISQRREQQLARFRDISTYQVIISDGVKELQQKVRENFVSRFSEGTYYEKKN